MVECDPEYSMEERFGNDTSSGTSFVNPGEATLALR